MLARSRLGHSLIRQQRLGSAILQGRIGRQSVAFSTGNSAEEKEEKGAKQEQDQQEKEEPKEKETGKEEETEQEEGSKKGGREQEGPSGFVAGLTVLGAIGGAVLGFSPDARHWLQQQYDADKRLCKTAWAVGKCTTRHWMWSLSKNEDKKSEMLKKCAEDALDLARSNQGIYIKLGQFVSTLGPRMIPEEYIAALSTLQDQAPAHSWKQTEEIFMDEFGELPSQSFAEIEREPIASASLAQVYRAKRGNRTVAVKVQHPDLADMFETDIRNLGLCAQFLSWRLGMNLEWIVPEFHKMVAAELNFENEGMNADKMRRLLRQSQNDDVIIPRIFWPASTRRILTMEYIDGIKINDKESLAAAGVSAEQAASLVSKTFNEQIFVHGFVHSDPHPGNIKILPSARRGQKPKLVLLDHGLYKSIDNNTRIAYASMWRSLAYGDLAGAERHASTLGVPEQSRTLLSLVLAAQSMGKNAGRQGPLLDARKGVTPEAKQKIKETVAAFQDPAAAFDELPRDLLYLIKVNNHVKSIVRDLGEPINRYYDVARYSVLGINKDVAKTLEGSLYIKAQLSYLEMRLRLTRFLVWCSKSMPFLVPKKMLEGQI